jgi:hypothetical protein
MDDEVYLEFEEEDEVKQDLSAPTSWRLLARYMASFKPNTRAMFSRLIDEAWHPRTGIEYSDKGKNYYLITLFSKGDYDFVKRGGPWIFDKNALIVTDLDPALQPSETVLNSVPVWVKIYDVPWGKQDWDWGMRYGNGIGEAMEVDVPASESQKREYLRVRVQLPYDRRLKSQLTVGVKGKPQEAKVFKLKYERLPYYCNHCGFMGHKTDVCEKKIIGDPSMHYETLELRCSPQKRSENRTFYVPPVSVKRGLSFSSLGSAESYKRFNQKVDRVQRRDSATPEHAPSHEESADDNEMPPLEDDPDFLVAMQARDADREQQVPAEVEATLAAGVDAMLVDQSQGMQPQPQGGRDAAVPIISFPDEEEVHSGQLQDKPVRVCMTEDMLSNLQRMHGGTASMASGGRSWHSGPRASDMIPALQGLSSLQVSFGSADTAMVPADTILGKRTAEEQEVQGERREFPDELDYMGREAGTPPKKGKVQVAPRAQPAASKGELVYTRSRNTMRLNKVANAATTTKLTGPGAAPRQSP